MLHGIVLHETVCVRRLCGGNHSREIRFGRFLSNEAVTVEQIIAGWSAQTRSAVTGRHVLALQDTSEFSFAAHDDTRHGLGKVKKGKSRGLLLHPMLGLDAENGQCLGLVGGTIWNRGDEKLPPHETRRLDQKESRRWVETAQTAKPVLAGADRVTFVADRESDFFVMWARVPDERHHLLTRAMHDHALADGELLSHAMQKIPFIDKRIIELRERADRPARQVTLRLRFGEASIRRSPKVREADMPRSVSLRWIEVVEENPPADVKEPLHWRILTTHAVPSSDQAWQIIAWYKQRWVIEQFFRTMKKQGLQTEDSQLQTAAGLEKLVAIAAKAAIIVIQLVQARDGKDNQPASLVFTPVEIETLLALEKRYKTKSKLLTNPHPAKSLAWASWIVARLGGWSGYASSKPPGPITYFHGLTYLKACADGWSMRDVYMP